MSWNTPKTNWVTNEVVAVADMNDIGENLEVLKNPASGIYTRSVGDYALSSTTWADVDAANMSHTIITTGGDVLVTFSGSVVGGSASLVNLFFDVAVDGVRQGGADGILRCIVDNARVDNGALVFWVTGLPAGSHTVKLQYKLSSGSAVIFASTTVSQFVVREVS